MRESIKKYVQGLGSMAQDSNDTGNVRDIILIVVSTAVITYYHYRPLHIGFLDHDVLHIILRRLYYIPILYAAFRFGVKGGLATSLSITALFAPHAVISMGGLFKGAAIDNFFDLLLYNIVALITGLVVEARRRQARRYREMLELNREIAEREAAIRKMKAYTDSVLGSVSSGVISVDNRGRVVTVNPEAARLLDRSDDDLVAFPLDKVFAGHDNLLASAKHVLEGEQRRATLEVELPAGPDKKTVAVRISPHISGGETVGIVITIEDLSEVKNLTEQLMRADKLSGLGELVAGVAHEVRNPLGVIKASVQMLEQETGAGSESEELTQVMVQEIDRLDALVNALLDFGRPSESMFGKVSVKQVLDEVILLTRHFARQQKVEVVRDFDGALPAIWADEDRLKQVFVNLTSNAFQSMPDGGRLVISADAESEFLKVSFADSGVGIPEDARKKIFDPFYTTRADGSGLGLSIVHRIVDAHKGYINVESSMGDGSIFVVGLPIIISSEKTGVEEIA